MSLLSLRGEIESENRLLIAGQTDSERLAALGPVLAKLQKLGIAPKTADQFRGALKTMNRASRGLVVEPADALRRAGLQLSQSAPPGWPSRPTILRMR